MCTLLMWLKPINLVQIVVGVDVKMLIKLFRYGGAAS
jgi:hypothetical protein